MGIMVIPLLLEGEPHYNQKLKKIKCSVNFYIVTLSGETKLGEGYYCPGS